MAKTAAAAERALFVLGGTSYGMWEGLALPDASTAAVRAA